MSRRAPMGLPADKLVGETPAEYARRQKPWGTGLPALGAEVAILHGRDDDEHLCVVVDYEVWPSLQKPHDPFNHRVLVHVVYKGSDIRNCRHLHELLPVSERTVARWNTGQHAPHERGPDGKEWAITDAAYRHVEGAVRLADSCSGTAPLWHGWALREAFAAGAEWQQARAGKQSS
ncbi:hypothetical protein QTI51_03900 [Variovorax sp. J22G73]|uniref:hypothetical protein n=1 Tax=unclassified Variovorax TaxID=663243 RepID=UPI002576A73C|nr:MULTISPECIES: hypothetical protein [unclassified Variovorax]MDM0003929.1 hypothetical protein [Variovorax sp. J22R203]MDM0096405.1 hypothetical protein [Variovorax sp. J22G73]